MKNKANHTIASPFFKWCYWALIILSATSLFACGSDSDRDRTDSNTGSPFSATSICIDPPSEQTTLSATEMESVSGFSAPEAFVGLYNSATENPISNLVPMDIQGDDYKTEFRSFAFKNALGLKGDLAGNSVEIVNYGSLNNDCIRIYSFIQNYETAIQFYTTVIHVLDKGISDEEIADQYAGFSYTGSSNIYLGPAGYISGYINTVHENGGVSGYEIMIDCTKLQFID